MQTWKKAAIFLAILPILVCFTSGADAHAIAVKATSHGHAANSRKKKPIRTKTVTTVTQATTEPTPTTPSAFMKHFFLTTNFRSIGTISIGSSISSDAGQDDSFTALGVSYLYSPHRANRPQGLYGLYFGREFNINSKLILQCGLGYYQSASYKARGIVTQGPSLFAAPPSQYTYTFISRRAVVEGKLLESFTQFVHPYVSFGMGAAFNTGYDYQVFNPLGTTSPIFAGSATAGFTYEAGVGLEVDVQKDIRLGAGYRFVNLGEADLGRGAIAGVSIPNTLEQTHLFANEFMAQLSYIF